MFDSTFPSKYKTQPAPLTPSESSVATFFENTHKIKPAPLPPSESSVATLKIHTK